MEEEKKSLVSLSASDARELRKEGTNVLQYFSDGGERHTIILKSDGKHDVAYFQKASKGVAYPIIGLGRNADAQLFSLRLRSSKFQPLVPYEKIESGAENPIIAKIEDAAKYAETVIKAAAKGNRQNLIYGRTKADKSSDAAKELEEIEEELQKLDEEVAGKESVTAIVPVGPAKTIKSAREQNEEYVQRMLKENQDRKLAQQQLAAALAVTTAKKAAEEEATKADLAKKAAARTNYEQGYSNTRTVNNAVEVVNALQGKVKKLDKELAAERKQRDEDMDVLGAEIDRQDEVIKTQNKKIVKRNVGLKYCVLAIAIVALASATLGIIMHSKNKVQDETIDKQSTQITATEEANKAKTKAEKDAAAKFNKVKDSELLVYENNATVARDASKVPTGVKESVVKELKNVSYQGIADSALDVYKETYSQILGEKVGSAVVSELYTNSYDWLIENVLEFNEDGSPKKDAEDNIVIKDYVFEADFSKHTPSAEDFEVGYEASFPVQLATKSFGKEVVGGNSIDDPSKTPDKDLETSMQESPKSWQDAAKDFITKKDEDPDKSTEIKNVSINGDVITIETENRLYEAKLKKNEAGEIVNSKGNTIDEINAQSAKPIVMAADLIAKYQTVESVLDYYIKAGNLPENFVQKYIYDKYKDDNAMYNEDDSVRAYFKITPQNGYSTVEILYLGQAEGENFRDDSTKANVMMKDGVDAAKALVTTVTGKALDGCSIVDVEKLEK